MKTLGWRAGAVTVLVATAISATALAAVSGTTHKVSGTEYLQAAGCPSTGSCIAVGAGLVNKENQSTGVYVDVSGGKPGTAHGLTGTTDINHVACPKANDCIAVGNALSGTSNYAVYVVFSHGKPGAVEKLGLEDAASIGCGSSDSCWVPGAECSSNGAKCTNKVVHLVDGKVAKTYSEQGTYSFSAGEGGGATPACSSATSCLLAGTAKPGIGPGVIFSLSDGKVKILHRVSGTSAISGLDCTSKSYCTVVGYEANSTGTKGKVFTLSGTKLGTPKTVNASLYPLACRSASACYSFGEQVVPHSTTGQPVVVTIDKGRPGSPQKISPDVLGATCTSKLCLGVGEEGEYPSQEGAVFSF